jgi:hypothetical protein
VKLRFLPLTLLSIKIEVFAKMALLMEPGSEPMTEEEKADFAAMESIREEAAVELKVRLEGH